MARHRSFRSTTVRQSNPSLKLLDGVVHPSILKAMRAASAQLEAAGVRHALAGALAVGAHGHPRATKDVDFLVGNEAFEHHAGGILTIAPGVPIAVGDVIVDPISIAPGEEYLDTAIDNSQRGKGVPVLPIGPLIYLKLKSPRTKDASDVVELIKTGIDVGVVSRYLHKHSPELEDKFEQMIAAALSEEED